jgi:UDP-N-acetylmuramoylalanine--D-glutamate ligase
VERTNDCDSLLDYRDHHGPSRPFNIEAALMTGSAATYYYVLGLGKSGLSALKYLQKHHLKVLAWDNNKDVRKAVPESILEAPETLPWQKIQTIILSPGIPHSGPNAHPLLQEAKKRGIPFTVDIELFLKQAITRPHYHIIGVTGTNGKSTTTSLLAHLLNHFGKKAIAAGNIGTPVLDLPDTNEETYFVLELSSYQLSLIKTPALECGILLNISPDHLAYHGSMTSYIDAKCGIFDLVKPNKHYRNVIGIDDAYTQAVFKKTPALLSISAESDQGMIHWSSDKIIAPQPNQSISVPNLVNLQGTHNTQNILACFAILQQILGKKFSSDLFIQGLQSFKSLPHRQEIVSKDKGILFINDSKATNMNAAEKSLKSFQNIHWILGGQQKEGENPLDLKPFFSHVTHTYLVGSAEDTFARDLKGVLPYALSHTIDKAVHDAYQNAKEGDVILLAPACASFDQFKNFEERGNFFKTSVETLLKARRGHHE